VLGFVAALPRLRAPTQPTLRAPARPVRLGLWVPT